MNKRQFLKKSIYSVLGVTGFSILPAQSTHATTTLLRDSSGIFDITKPVIENKNKLVDLPNFPAQVQSKIQIQNNNPSQLLAKTIKLQKSFIAGLYYYQAQKYWQYIQQDGVLVLRIVPTNKYDKRAIEVYYKLPARNIKLGYIPKIHNEPIFNMLKAKIPIMAKITNKYKNDDNWLKIDVKLSLLKNI
ncbi:MAG: hypothetical protein DRQ51_06730 [Gammaproteobacteria bacterium]|nr:MAG: hypothetical protein DRQ51_06730 [Gammaproteobacteria bacterium]